MANDGGLIATLEQWFADQAAALVYGGAAVFKTADIWRHQVDPIEGGAEKFDGVEPFFFVSYIDDESAREGDNDLRQVLTFAILVGCAAKAPGAARFGDAAHLGTSKIRDLLIALFDRNHPGGSFACDEIYYAGATTVVADARRHAIQMKFETSFLTTPNA